MIETRLSEKEIDALVDEHPHHDMYDNCLYCGNRDADNCPTVKLGNFCKAQARELLDLRAKVERHDSERIKLADALEATEDELSSWLVDREAVQAENRQLREALRDFALELGPNNPRSCSRQYVAQRIQKLAALGEKP